MSMITCDQIQNHLSDIIEGDMQSIDSKDLNEHLSLCRQCHELYQRANTVKSILANLSEIHTSYNFENKLHSRIEIEL